MPVFYMNEARFELPDDTKLADRTVTYLTGASPSGSTVMLLVERRPAPSGTLRQAVDEHGADLMKRHLGYAVLFDREVEVASRWALDVGARWLPEGRPPAYTRRTHLIVGSTWLILTGEAPLTERELCDQIFDRVLASLRTNAPQATVG